MIRTVSGERFATREIVIFDEFLSSAWDLSFTSLGQAGFVSTWAEHRFGDTALYAQAFDLSGRPLADRFTVGEGDVIGAPHVLATPEGDLFVTWSGGIASGVRGAFYALDGTRLSPEIQISTTEEGFQGLTSVAALPGGGYAVVWQHDDGGPTWNSIRFQLLSADGARIGGEQIASGANPGDKYAATVIALEGGGFAISWNESVFDPGIKVRIYNAAGDPVSGEIALSPSEVGVQSGVTIAALPGGGFAAAWYDNGDVQFGGPPNAIRGIWVSVFDSAGQRVGTAVHEPTIAGPPSIAVTATGFNIVWQGKTGEESAFAHWAQSYDFAGQPVGTEFLLSPRTFEGSRLQAVGLANGAFLAGWTEDAGSSGKIVAELVYPITHGTAGAELFAGTEAPDYYFGHEGADQLSGGAQSDGLAGGAGDDVLTGGEGDDILDGGTGADIMTGGTGNDVYTVDDSADQVIENADEGIDSVETSLADYAASAAIENLTGTRGAGATQTLHGNALSNVLTGGAADNVFLLGMGGNDRLFGGDGVDSAVIDWSASTNDVVTSSFPYVRDVTLLFTNGTESSVGFLGVELITLTTGSGDDLIAMPGDIFGPVRGSVFTGAGDDRVYLNGSLDSADGGSGTDGIHVGVGGQAGQNVEFRIPTNLFLSWAGTTQITNFEYFLSLYTGDGDDIVETGTTAHNDQIASAGGDDEIIVYNGADIVDLGFGGDDLLVVDWRALTEDVSLTAYSYYDMFGHYYVNGYGFAGSSVSVDFSNAERLRVLSGSGADSLTGGVHDDELDGGAGNDELNGGYGDDLLRGGLGDDVLYGGDLGLDVLEGGAGNDTYDLYADEDTVTELAGEGVDTVRTVFGSASDYAQMYTLPDNVENLVGVSTAAQGVDGNALDNHIKMAGGNDLVVLDAGGNDRVEGGAGADYLYFGGSFTNADSVDGGAGSDTVGLVGNYTIAFDADDLVSVEKLAVYSSGNHGAPAGYALTTNDANVAAGQTLTIIAQSLQANELLTFNGSAETNGSFSVKGGRGADTITGGAGADVIWGNLGADTLRGGAGNDSFVYQSAAESTAAARDLILDFAWGDRVALLAIDPDGDASNGNGKFAFIGSDAFHQVAGELRVTQDAVYNRAWLVEGDTDGDGAADFSLYVVAQPGQVIGANDFLL